MTHTVTHSPFLPHINLHNSLYSLTDAVMIIIMIIFIIIIISLRTGTIITKKQKYLYYLRGIWWFCGGGRYDIWFY